MNLSKIVLVLKREYLTRVRKKSFMVMTILAPLLLVSFYGVIIYFAVNRDIGDNEKRVYVVDETNLYAGKLASKEKLEFSYGTYAPYKGSEKSFLEKEGYYAVLHIPSDTTLPITLTAIDEPSLSTNGYIENQLEQVARESKLSKAGIAQSTLDEVNKTNIHITTAKATETGTQNTNAEANTALGFIGAILIYMFIFLYGVQVMRGVIEEKTNRIIEVIISSLKPFELMMGKITGIALVGLTQFLIWVLLITVLGGSASGLVMANMQIPAEGSQQLAASSNGMGGFMQALLGFNYVYFIGVFVFYFISGYLFYGALFAAIGSAVDNETDTQQFMLPVTLPLVFALVLAQSAVATNPNGPLAVWLSVIPFTSPVVMMVRLPFGVPNWQLVLSMVSMVIGFVSTVWLAAKIYRIGILMYGKKTTYKEISKWLFYKG